MKQAVVYIITKLELGGAQKVCLSLFKGLQNQHISATLISGSEGKLVDEVASSPQTILLDTFKREVGLRSLWAEVKTFFKLVSNLRQLKKENPQLIVHTHSTKAGLLGRWAAFFAGIRHRVHTIHGYGFHNHQPRIIWFAIYFLELLTSCITTHFVCVSEDDVTVGLKLLPGFKKKYSIIRAAVDDAFFFKPATKETTFTDNKDRFVFGTIACFKKQKNLFDLLQAFALVHEKNVATHLEIIGDGILRPAIEQWIKEHDLDKHITLHGWQDNVIPFLQRWDAFVLSSLWEGLPCSIVEARLMKLPVLSYDTGGIHEVISSGKNGFLYSQGKWHELADGMLHLTQEPHHCYALKTFDDNLTEFSKNTMIDRHIHLYNSLAQKR
jgi:glycosyltransferase involved in cell wall biosynthesis